jgi:hypothetical protein
MGHSSAIQNGGSSQHSATKTKQNYGQNLMPKGYIRVKMLS